jgi:arabinofuranosyltransferase
MYRDVLTAPPGPSRPRAGDDARPLSPPRERATPPGRRPAPGRWLGRALPWVPVPIVAVGAWAHRYNSEDAFINFRIVDHLLAGHGPVFNAGERVEAYTSALWLGVLTLARLLTGGAVSLPVLAVALGLALSVAAVALAISAARRWPVERGRAGSGVVVPVGALIVAGSPAIWRYATSGLESSLSFFWLAACFRGVVDGVGRPAPDRRVVAVTALALGAGPLVRPELGLYTVAFVVALAATVGSWSQRARIVALAAVVPVAYQLFRMAYFGVLLPNTGIAKNATVSHWDWGVDYLVTFARSWHTGVALLAGATVVAWRLQTRSAGARDRLVFAAPVVGALAHAAYVLRVGGDYMYGRFAVVPLFAFLLPVAAVELPRLRAGERLRSVLPAAAAVAAGCVAVSWAGATMVRGGITSGHSGLALRDYGMLGPSSGNPVETADYPHMRDQGRRLAVAAATGTDAFIDDRSGTPVSTPLPPGRGLVSFEVAIGVVGYEAGPGVRIIDGRGLADPVASRIPDNMGADAMAGHEKDLPLAYAQALAGAPEAFADEAVQRSDALLRCPGPAELLDAVTGRLTPERITRNITGSVRRTTLRIPLPGAGNETPCAEATAARP